MSRDEDIRFMRRALELARRGSGRVSPNPMVGCVIVSRGRVVGEGWHAVFGGLHAEPRALERAGSRARGATAYVNLEPCCHEEKKTPPCVPALVRAGIRRVVVGMSDPNPRVSGRGIRRLRRAGIAVTAGALRKECESLNRPFIVRMREGRPYVILKAAASLDGRIATAAGESKWITSPQARRAAHRMRAEADAVLVGIGTVLKDDPSLTSHGAGRDPLRVVLDSRLRALKRPGARVLDGKAATILMTSRARLPEAPALVSCRATARRVPRRGGGLDLRAALRYLREIHVGTVLVEGGSRVHTSFLQAGLVDELRLFLAPRLIGGGRARGFFEGKGVPSLRRALRVSELGVRRLGPDLLVTGRLG